MTFVEGYVPPGRTPSLPLGARSGWELQARLEPIGLKIRGYDLIPEELVTRQCLEFMMARAKRPPEGVKA